MYGGEGGWVTFRGVILFCPDALSWINLKKYPNLDQGSLLNVFCHIRTFYHKLCSNVCNLLNFKKKLVNIQKRSNISSCVVGIENRIFNPILAIATIWTLLSPSLCKCKLFCCSASTRIAVCPEPPFPHTFLKKTIVVQERHSQCAGRSTFFAFLGNSEALVRKLLMWKKPLVQLPSDRNHTRYLFALEIN